MSDHHSLIDPEGGAKRKRVLLAVSDKDLEVVDALAKVWGCSRAEAYRRAASWALASSRSRG